ncbi:TPA: acyltransferase family protein [Escherichia coli]|nr:acyltransferase [Escherichia coli]
MDRITSIYLDVARFTAAVLVVLSHAPSFIGLNFGPLSSLGPEAVVVFFVLSGYVISYVTETKEKRASDYFLARAKRIYSVLIPAMVVTVFADYVGTQVDIGFYSDHGNFSNDYSITTVVSILTFTGEVLSRHIVFGSNEPIWSLGFECVYYVIFGIVFFCKNRVAALMLSALILIIAMPKVSVFFPLWLLGVAIQKYKNRMSGIISTIVFLCGALGILVIKYKFHGVTPMYKLGFGAHDFYKSVAYFYGIGVAFGLTVFVAKSAMEYVKGDRILVRYEAVIRWLSAKTFSLYIVHLPLMMLFVVSLGIQSLWQKIICLFLTIFTCFIFSEIFESKKGIYFVLISRLASLLHSNPPYRH